MNNSSVNASFLFKRQKLKILATWSFSELKFPPQELTNVCLSVWVLLLALPCCWNCFIWIKSLVLLVKENNIKLNNKIIRLAMSFTIKWHHLCFFLFIFLCRKISDILSWYNLSSSSVNTLNITLLILYKDCSLKWNK